MQMEASKVIDISQHRQFEKKPKRKRKRKQKGSVLVRGNKLWFSFYYHGKKVREPSGYTDTPQNKKIVRSRMDLIMAEIDDGRFEFSRWFPRSRSREYFAELEGREVKVDPGEILFGDYADDWWKAMSPGMSRNQIRDYTSILNVHLLPEFGDLPFREFRSVRIKKFVAKLKSHRQQNGKPLSGKRIQNIFIPLRIIVRDAIAEYGWTDFPDPFFNLKLPPIKKRPVHPFEYYEWQTFRGYLNKWYLNYFDFAVQTGLRPSEQVALKWNAIHVKHIDIVLSRVRNREKTDLKNEHSRREIELRPEMSKVLDNQREQVKDIDSPYVFLTPIGTPIIQDRLREQWAKAMKASGLPHRRMYETRHTFASWALQAGELPGWVAKTLGHADTSMIHRHYARHIKHPTRQDGSAFELRYRQMTQEGGDEF